MSAYPKIFNTMLDKKIRIGYISPANPFDRKALSGTPYKIGETLRSIGAELVWIQVKQSKAYKLYDKICRLFNKIFPNKILVSHTALGATLLSKSLDLNQIKEMDLLFSPLSSDALFNIDKHILPPPIMYLSDATFERMVGYYFHNLYGWNIKEGNKVEQKAQDISSQLIFSSDWAASSAIEFYHQPASKVHVIEFGANIDDKDIVKKTFVYNGTLHLLFLGVDWVRKGGDLAVEACKELNEMSIKSVLHVVGIRNLSSEIKSLPFVDYVGFLDKNNQEDYNKLISLIRMCHCLLLPTKAECAGIAFCESSANGLPAFSHVTGGVRNYVEDGVNGYLLPLGSTGKDFANKIKECLQSGELERMSLSATELYKQKLNWKVWGEKVEKLIRDTLEIL